MHRPHLLLSVLLILLFLAGCSSAPVNHPSVNNNSGVPVSLSITDDPPNGVTVLFFEINLTEAYLTPSSGSGNVSLLSNNTPIQIDVTQLQAISAFLNTANVPTGTYNSLTLTFASPQLVIYNASDQSIASTCPINNVCQLTPQIDNNSSTLTFSSAPFPVTVADNTPLGFLLDFHLNEVIQSDLSVNLGVANGVTINELPPTPPGPPQFGFLSGTVQNVDTTQNQFTLQVPWGKIFTIDVNSNTSYENFPSSACSTSGFSCVVEGEVVQVQVASVQSDGSLLAATVSYVEAVGQQVAEGNIINLGIANGNTVMTLVLHWSPNAGTLPFGGIASVTVPSTATFSVDSGSFTIPSGLSFASASDLLIGQNVQVDVVSGTLSSSGGMGPWSPPSVSFTTNSVELEPSQITGMISATNASESNFTIATFPNFFAPWSNSNWTSTQITVGTTSQTTYEDLNPDSFSGLTVNNMVSVRGWLFSTPSGATASTQVAERIKGRSNGYY